MVISGIKKQKIVKFFWNSLVSFLFFLLFLKIESSLHALKVLYLLHAQYGLIISVAVYFGLILGGVIFSSWFYKNLQLQKVRSQPSWFYYLTQGFKWATVVFLLVQLGKIFHYSPDLFFSLRYDVFCLWRWIIENWLLFALLSAVEILQKYVGSKLIPDFITFAPEAVGKEQDAFDFATSAKNTAIGIEEIKKYVSVLGLYGAMGSGKSSFVRMVIENLPKEETLYTYISLTETNEAKGFSNLFADRWFKTLAERYPKIDIPNYLPLINNILRENGQGFWSGFIELISHFSFGFLKTFSKTQDITIIKKSDFVSETVAEIFGNIPNLTEKRWVIVIDEIERAQFDEIYRVVEVIERFKNEGRTGMPLSLIFILCISRNDLDALLTNFENKDVRAYQIRTFFEHGKSITQPIFVPPVHSFILDNYVAQKTIEFARKENIKINESNLSPNTISDPLFQFIEEKDALNYATGLIAQLTPREISRIFSSLTFFFQTFRNQDGDQKKDFVRLGDFMVMEYIKIRSPYLIEFFKNSIGNLVIEHERNNLANWMLKRSFKEEKIDLIGWIEKTTGKKLTDQEKTEANKLIAFVANSYLDFLQREESSESRKITYEGTLSYPENMNDYLSIIAENTNTTFKQNNRIYREHQKSKNTLENLNPLALANYARFLSNLRVDQTRLYVDVLDRLTYILVSGKTSIDKGNIGDTVFDEVIYRFVFSAMNILERESFEEPTPSENIKKVLISLTKVVKSEMVTVGGKIIIFNSFANNERGRGSSIHISLDESFRKLIKYYKQEIIDLMEFVFVDFDKRYFVDKKVIYENEENYFYTMYQNWSGKADAYKEIEKIRFVAANGLSRHPEFIKVYWDRYPYDPSFESFRDVQKNHRMFMEDFRSNTLYMPLETLIKVTREAKIDDPEIIAKLNMWSKNDFVNHPSFKEMIELKDDHQTLKSVLIKNGFLKSIE